MSTNDSYSAPARHFLGELETALAAVSGPVRAEIIGDIAAELAGLDAEAARARIAALGDPRAIAADASAEALVPDIQPQVSRAYPMATAIVLTAGWYVVPIIGWLAGLVMIGVGKRWLPQARVAAGLVSVAAAVIAVGALLLMRGTDMWLLGLSIFLLLPLPANILVSSYLRREWSPAPTNP